MASTFSEFVKTFLEDVSPKGGMFGGVFIDPQTGIVDRALMSDTARSYYADPFRRQNAINASLDEALKQKQTEQAAQKLTGLFGGDGGGDPGLNPYVAAYLDAGGGAAGKQAQEALQFQTFMSLPATLQGLVQSIFPGKVNSMEKSFYAINPDAVSGVEQGGYPGGFITPSLGATVVNGTIIGDYEGGMPGGGGTVGGAGGIDGGGITSGMGDYGVDTGGDGSFGASFGGAISESGDL